MSAIYIYLVSTVFSLCSSEAGPAFGGLNLNAHATGALASQTISLSLGARWASNSTHPCKLLGECFVCK